MLKGILVRHFIHILLGSLLDVLGSVCSSWYLCWRLIERIGAVDKNSPLASHTGTWTSALWWASPHGEQEPVTVQCTAVYTCTASWLNTWPQPPELLTEPGPRVASHLGKLLPEPEHQDHTATHVLSQLGWVIFGDKLNQCPVKTKSHFLLSFLLGASPVEEGQEGSPWWRGYSSAIWQSQRSLLSFQLKALFLFVQNI